ncbi:MAG TPA: phage head-tail connector protein [Ruminococcus flavefaciens]|nr:phage head-tail connector protein [Ruminococcus flavefaciens]
MATVDGLCTLASVKLLLGISDTSKDALLESFISEASAEICTYTGRVFKRATYTSEPYAVNGQLYLYLKQWPIQSVISVKLGDLELTLDLNYCMSDADAAIGRLYRPQGWYGKTIKRGLVPDSYEGDRDILVSYIAGYYLPDDTTTPPATPHYVAGASDSLPIDLQAIAKAAVCLRYNAIQKGVDGLSSMSEGGVSYSFTESTNFLNADIKRALTSYKRYAV